MTKKTDLLVVGAGASGLLCAGYAAKRGLNVLVLEKMDIPARKLMITGKGRCNLTNNCTKDEFLAAVRNGSKFLHSAISAFNAQDLMVLIESLGVALKTERGNRVFPVSDRSVDIVDALVSFAKSNGAKIIGGKATKLIIENNILKGVETNSGDIILAKNVVLATGGKSYPLTGSTGDGYALAQQAGHNITKLRPSLIPIVTAEKWCSEAMGLSLKNIVFTVTMSGKKKPVYSEMGELLFTHFGISGPLVLSASAHMDKNLELYKAYIDLKPALSIEQLDARILRDFAENINREFANSLNALLPRALIPIIIKISKINPQQKVNQITKEQRRDFALLVKALPLTPRSFRGVDEAVITAGGVNLKEVNPKTMESKLLNGLYFIGEILDLDAYTGGFNLQIAFSTAFLAGNNVGLNYNQDQI